MVSFKNVCFLKDTKKIILYDLNLDSLKTIMDQNEFNTIILDSKNGRFLFYDCINKVADKYELYDLNVLSKSNESFDMIILLKGDENQIKHKIEVAEKYRMDCGLSILKNENEQQEEKPSSAFCNTTINNISLCEIDEEQPTNKQINYEKTILQYDDDDSDRPTFNDIIKLKDVEISFSGELEDDEYDENNVNQQITNDVNDEDQSILPDDKKSDVPIRQEISAVINTDVSTTSEHNITSMIMGLANSFTSMEKNINERLNVIENNVNKRLNKFEERLNRFEDSVNKRLSLMENNMNLIYERQSVQSLLRLLNSIYLISSERLENRKFNSTESPSTLKFFHFVSNQLIKTYLSRWSLYKDLFKISLRPHCIEINLLGFGRLEKKC
jgi:hypothetical protein